MRILAITQSYAPSQNAEAVVVTKLCGALKSAGHDVDVLARRSARRPNTSKLKTSAGQADTLPPAMSRSMLPFAGLRHSTRKIFGHRTLQTVRYMREMIWAKVEVWRTQEAATLDTYDVILSFGGYCHLASLSLASQYGTPIIANWNDPFPPMICPPPYGAGAEAHIPWVYSRLLERVGKLSKWHTFASARLMRYMLPLLPCAEPERCSVIPHIAAPTPRAAHRQSDVFTLTHAGGLGPQRRVDNLFTALRTFASNKPGTPHVRLRFIGPGTSDAQALAERYGIAALCEFRNEMWYETCQDELKQSDVLVLIEAPMAEGIFLPSKLVDYAQADRPILAISPSTSTVADLLTQFGGGIAADASSSEDIQIALGRLYDAWEEGALDRLFSPRRLLGEFSAPRVIGEYERIFGQLVTRSVGSTGAPL